MDQLPQELIDRISRLLPRKDLKNTLLLSKAFRFPAEKYSWAFHSFKLDEENAAQFLNTFSGHRFSFLRSVEFQPILPRIEYTYPHPRETESGLREKDKDYTRQIAFLFTTMKELEDRARLHNKYGKIELIIRSPMRLVAHEFGRVSYQAHSSWRVHLLEPGTLALLESVRSIDFRNGGIGTNVEDGKNYGGAPVKLDLRVMIDLVTRLPNLEFWGCKMTSYEWSRKRRNRAVEYFERDWAGPRRDTRHDFAGALENASLPSSLRRVRLDFMHGLFGSTDIDHFTTQPNLTTTAPNDPFSLSLQHLSQHLRRVHLRVVADETLFWDWNSPFNLWLNLEILVVMFHMVSPSGAWYFEGPGGEGRDMTGFDVTDASYPPFITTPLDEDMEDQVDSHGELWDDTYNYQLRIVPNDTTLRPFLKAFATATAKMVALKTATLWCPLAWQSINPELEDDLDYDHEEVETDWLSGEVPYRHNSPAWGIYYLASGERDYNTAVASRSETRQISWKVAKWRPDPELHELFQQIGRGTCGGELIEHWEDERFGQCLVDTEFFEVMLEDQEDNMGRILDLC
jgi:hypothetical protein